MTVDPSVLTLAQWLSPAFPVGAFAYSHGLEHSIATGQVASPSDLHDWVTDVLDHGSGRNDAVFLAAAYAADDVTVINDWAVAFAASKERLLETEAQGAAFAQVMRRVWALDLADGCYPVVVGRAAGLKGLPLNLCAALYLQAFAGTLVSVGQRLIPIGQSDAQHIVSDLSPLCTRIATETEDGDLDRLSSTVFMTDVAAMQHETQHSKVFRS